MSTIELKNKAHSLIDAINDSATLQAIITLLNKSETVENDWWFLGITAVVALIIFALDYVIPIIGTKKFGGTKAGMIGTTIGLIVGLLAPIPGGIFIGAFAGAFIGELSNKADNKTALKAAFGSFLGLLTGAFMKFTVTAIFLVFFLKIAIENGAALNPF